MGRRFCCVLNCPTNFGNKANKSLFTVPLKDSVMYKKWQEALAPHVDRTTFPFAKRSFVCELHFLPKQLDRVYMMRLADGTTWRDRKDRSRLFPGSVPCLFSKNELNTPKSKETYVFDIEESSDDNESPSDDGEVDDVRCRYGDEGELAEESPVEEAGEKHTLTTTQTDDDEFEIIFCGSPHNFDDTSNDVVDAPADGDQSAEVSCSYADNQIKRENNTKPNASQMDVMTILRPPDPGESVINDIHEFSRLCRKYVTTDLAKKGRPGLMDLYGLGPSISSKDVFVYPRASLDVETLLSHIDHVKLPSENWFCTVKDGSPTFLCWNESYSIQKKVFLDVKNLVPIVHLGDVPTSLSEIARPRSIHEVNNILKLVDSAEKCPQKDPRVCKGYFFPAKQGMTMCRSCMRILDCDYPEENQPFNADLVKQTAADIIAGYLNWSFTILGSTTVFISWKKPFIPEKLYILRSDLEVEVIFTGDNVVFDEICSPQSINDVRSAIKFLDGCMRCEGVDDFHRSNRCRKFIHQKTRKMRIRTCKACADVRKKLIRAMPGSSLVKRSKAKHNLPSRPLKLAATIRVKEEDDSSDQTQEADEVHVLLPDVLDSITLPSSQWTHAVLDSTVIFQYWKDDFTLLKKIVIKHDLSVMIFVLDRIVEFDEIDAVTSVDDVVEVLNLVDCLRLCEGYDELHRKSKECVGYFYDSGEASSYRCANCMVARSHDVFRIPTSERDSDDSDPPSKKVALEITLTPPSPQYSGIQDGDVHRSDE